MKRLYRGGKISPLLHDIDATNWIAAGWSESPTAEPAPTKDDHAKEQPQELQRGRDEVEAPQAEETEAELNPDYADPLPPIEDRLTELQALADDGNWRALKAIAEGHGIGRPDDGWDASVLPILVAEYGQQAAEEVYTQPE